MSDKDELVEFPQHTMIDTDLAREEPAADEKTTVYNAEPESPAPASAPEQEEEEPAATMMFQSPFTEPQAEPPAPKARLVVAFGNDRGKEYDLPRSTVVIGRSLEASIVLNDPTVSRKHFEIHFIDGRWVLKDLGSGNGTRIGGEKVGEVVLDEGMQIEVGQSLLTFTSDEAKTRAIELPDPATMRGGVAPRTQGRAAVAEVHVEAPPRIQVEQPADVVEGRRFPVALVVVGVVLLAVIGVAVAQFGLGIRILPIGGAVQTADEVAAAPDAAALRAEAADLQARGMKAFQARDWDQAIGLLEQAVAKDGRVEGLEAGLARARDEKKNAALLASAKAAFEKGRAEEAVRELGKVADTSIYFSEARSMLASAGDPAVSKEIDRIRELLGGRKKGEAREGYVALVQSHPDDDRVLALRDELVKAGIALDPPPRRHPAAVAVAADPVAPPPVPAPSPAPSPAPAPAPSKPGKPGTGKLDPTRAMQLYNAGSFDQASSELKALADKLKPDDAARARDLAGRIERFAAAFGDGKAALASKRLDKAEQGLSVALRLDHEVNGHFDAEIRGLLGDTYRGRAAAAMQNADYVQAAKSAKRALSYKAEDTLSKQILDKCIAMAQTSYTQAVADVQAGRKDAARGKLRMVLDIVPSSHQLAEKAAEMMQQVR